MNSPSLGASKLRSLVIQAATQEIAQDDATMDLSGILWMEHINLIVGDLDMASAFYLDFLGFTQDPTKSFFHMNLGQQQFHLAMPKTADESVHTIAGSIGLTVPSLESVIHRIPQAKEVLETTKFEILQTNLEEGYLTLQGPWGNTFHIYDLPHDSAYASSSSAPNQVSSSSSSSPQSTRTMEDLHDWGGNYGSHRMAVRQQPGIRYLELTCQKGTSRAIGNFYQQMLPSRGIHSFDQLKQNQTIEIDTDGIALSVGPGVHIVFAEQEEEVAAKLYDSWMEATKGIHICVYVEDFRELYQRLAVENLVWSNPRFKHLDSCDTWKQAKSFRTSRFRYIEFGNQETNL
jgi:catechol 2,3-dioxygenase-like lactoylglutathione lyase family enzyme